MNTEIFNSRGLFGRVEPALLEKWIHLPEVQSSNLADSRYGFQVNALAVAEMGCCDLLDRR